MTVLALYGATLGLMSGHLWFWLFVAPSPRDFLHRQDLWSSEPPFYLATGLLGTVAVLWLGVGATNGHFGFAVPHRRAAAIVGATHGAAAGFVWSMLFTLNIAAPLVTSNAPWALSPHWAVLFEVSIGIVAGAAFGAPVGALLAKVSVDRVVDAKPSRAVPKWVRAQFLARAGFASAAYVVAATAAKFIASERLTGALVVVAAGLVYSAAATIYMHRISVFAMGPAVERVVAVTLGCICGGGVGLRFGLYAMAVGWDDQIEYLGAAVVSGALAGAGIAHICRRAFVEGVA